jgi:hypothetical protein
VFVILGSPRFWKWVSVLITSGVWLAIALVVKSGVTLRNPPFGQLVYEQNNRRVYVLRNLTDAQQAEVHEWAQKYSGAGEGNSEPAASNRILESQDSGDVATVMVAKGPQTVLLVDRQSESLRGRDMAVWVNERHLSLAQFVTRVKVALLGHP